MEITSCHWQSPSNIAASPDRSKIWGLIFRRVKYSLKAGLFQELLLKCLISPFHPFPSPAIEGCTAAPFPLLFVLPCYEILCVGQPCVAPLVCKDKAEHKGACPSSGIDCAGRVLPLSVPGKIADALVTKVSKGKGKVFLSRCPLPRYFAWLSHGKLPCCPRLCLKNTSRTFLGWAPGFCWLENAGHRRSAQWKPKEQSKAAEVRAVGRGLDSSLCPAQQVLMLLEMCAAWQAVPPACIPARNELRNFEMLIRQQSLTSEPFPRGSYSGAIYSWNCKS